MRFEDAEPGIGVRHRVHSEAEGSQVLREEVIQPLVVVDDEDSRAHSRLSARIGGISDARRAGNAPKPKPIIVAIPSDTREASHGMPSGQVVLSAMTVAPPTPTTIPPIQPPSANSVASNRN